MTGMRMTGLSECQTRKVKQSGRRAQDAKNGRVRVASRDRRGTHLRGHRIWGVVMGYHHIWGPCRFVVKAVFDVSCLSASYGWVVCRTQ